VMVYVCWCVRVLFDGVCMFCLMVCDVCVMVCDLCVMVCDQCVMVCACFV